MGRFDPFLFYFILVYFFSNRHQPIYLLLRLMDPIFIFVYMLISTSMLLYIGSHRPKDTVPFDVVSVIELTSQWKWKNVRILLPASTPLDLPRIPNHSFPTINYKCRVLVGPTQQSSPIQRPRSRQCFTQQPFRIC